jgi:hypothetical protein
MKKLAALVATLAAIVVFAGFSAAPAWAAGESTTTTFTAPSSQTVDFGSNWVVPVKVTSADSYYPMDQSSGTVNILVGGQPGTYATGLPLTAAGIAYMSPPSSKPPLGAGTYQLTAVFVPSGGSGLTQSQSAAPATLIVTPLTLSASFSATSTTSGPSGTVTVHAGVKPTGNSKGTPAGSWKAVAKDAAGKTVATNSSTADANQSYPIAIKLAPTLKRGDTYTISADFTPSSDVAGGYTITTAGDQKLTLSEETLAEKMSDPLDLPIWAIILIALGLAALIAALIVLIVRRRSPSDTISTNSPAESVLEAPLTLESADLNNHEVTDEPTKSGVNDAVRDDVAHDETGATASWSLGVDEDEDRHDRT